MRTSRGYGGRVYNTTAVTEARQQGEEEAEALAVFSRINPFGDSRGRGGRRDGFAPPARRIGGRAVGRRRPRGGGGGGGGMKRRGKKKCHKTSEPKDYERTVKLR